MAIMRRISRQADRLYDRMRSPKAAEVAQREPTGGIDQLRGHRYCVLVSYRRDGTPVPSPVWFGVQDGRLYVRTGVKTAKVARIRHNPQVRVAPSDGRGEPRGAPFAGRARILDAAEEQRAEQAISANYGWGRKVYMRLFTGRVAECYIEVVPDGPAAN